MMLQESKVTVEAVMAALSQVQDPELHRDLVSLGMIKDVVVEDGRVSFAVVLTTPACPLRNQIEREARLAVEAIPGVEEVQLSLQARVPGDGHDRPVRQQTVRNAVAIASGKGGVGKTTVAVNVAVALARAGAKVGLVDADVYGPNVPTMLGVDELPPAGEELLVPALAHGIKVMSIAFMIQPGQAVIWRGPMLHSVIRQFVMDVDWGDLDYLIIDLPPGTGDAALSLVQSMALTGVVIVTLPQKVSLEDAYRSLEMFRLLKVPILGVVENMSYLDLPNGERMDIFGMGGGESLARDAGVPFVGGIPMDPEVRMAGDTGTPVVVSHPESQAGKALTSISEHIAAKVSVRAHGKDGGVT